MPGRGNPGAAAPGGLVSFATRSGRGGTIGLAEGCPARLGFAGGRNGPPPPGVAIGAPGARLAGGGAPGRGLGRGGNGRLGIRPGAGRGAPGVLSAAARGASPGGDGKGCRGPERICPGLGAGGAGLAGIGMPRGAIGGVSGGPEDNGGRKGAERVGAGACAGAGSAGVSRA